MKVYQNEATKIVVYFKSNVLALKRDNYEIYTIINSWLIGGGTVRQGEGIPPSLRPG